MFPYLSTLGYNVNKKNQTININFWFSPILFDTRHIKTSHQDIPRGLQCYDNDCCVPYRMLSPWLYECHIVCESDWQLWNTLSTIHDVAEPQAISTMSSRMFAHPFQKSSRAGTKSDLGESIHGISSIKTTRFPFVRFFVRRSSSRWKASNQFCSAGLISWLLPVSESLSFFR